MKLKAMTLAEVLVAIAIGSIVFSLFFSFVASQNKAVRRKLKVDHGVLESHKALRVMRDLWRQRDPFRELEIEEGRIRFVAFPRIEREDASPDLISALRDTIEFETREGSLVVRHTSETDLVTHEALRLSNVEATFIEHMGFHERVLVDPHPLYKNRQISVTLIRHEAFLLSNALLTD